MSDKNHVFHNTNIKKIYIEKKWVFREFTKELQTGSTWPNLFLQIQKVAKKVNSVSPRWI